MSDGIGLSGVGVGKSQITMDGKAYLVEPWTLRDYATIEKHYIRLKRRQRQQMTLDLRDDMPPDLWAEEWAIAKKEAAAITNINPVEFAGVPPELDDSGGVVEDWRVGWMDTLEGKAFTLWVLFEKSHPGLFSLEELTDKLEKMSFREKEEISEACDQATSKDLLPEALKNSEGSTAPVAVEPRDEAAKKKSSVGEKSSGS